LTLEVVGAGLGRTGTNSLKLALEELLGGPCYHMYELMQRPGDMPAWEAAAAGSPVDWAALFACYRAAVDWPAASFWREILEANPDSVVLLSSRDSAQTWWASMEQTIVRAMSEEVPSDEPEWARRRALNLAVFERRFTSGWAEPSAAMAAYERHNAAVRSIVPAERLIDWRPGDGWEPICAKLALEAPLSPFPHENRTADFRANLEIESSPGSVSPEVTEAEGGGFEPPRRGSPV
jgi:hypothetical protein